MKILTLTIEPKQKLTVLFEDTTIVIVFRFNPTVQLWTMNITFRDEVLVNGKSVVLGTPLLEEFNMPFDLICVDNQKVGIDPFQVGDFASNRVSLYLLEREDTIELRGYDVI